MASVIGLPKYLTRISMCTMLFVYYLLLFIVIYIVTEEEYIVESFANQEVKELFVS